MSDHISLFVLNVLAVLLGVFYIGSIMDYVADGNLAVKAGAGFVSLCMIALSIAVAVIFGRITKRKNRKKLLMFLFICMVVCRILLLVIGNVFLLQAQKRAEERWFVQRFMNYYYEQYGTEFYIDNEKYNYDAKGYYSISLEELEKYIKENEDIYGEDFREFQENDSIPDFLREVYKMLCGLIPAILYRVIFYGALFLFILSMDNDPNKLYASKSEPDGKHIKTRSIAFSILLSIMTLGIYYMFIWRYSIMSDIRKVRKRGSIAVGEMLLYTFIPFYSLYWLYTRGSALTVVCGNNKLKSAGSGGLFIFFELIFLGFINTILIQNTLNDLAKVMDKNFIYGDIIHTDYSASTGVADSQDRNIKKIKDLYELKEKGIISEEEYEEKKKHFLEQI